MTGAQKIGVLLIVLGLLYALLYVGWLRRSRKEPSAEGRSSGPATKPARGPLDGGKRPSAAGPPPRALTLACAEGTYVGTNKAITRQERVVAAKRAVRVPATMVVDDTRVRWERNGTGDVTVAGTQLLGVSLERDPGGSARTNIVRVSWQANSGDQLATVFVPRKRAESAALVSAVQQLMKIGASQGQVGHVGGSIQDSPPKDFPPRDSPLRDSPPQDSPPQDTPRQDTPPTAETGLQSRAGTIQDGTP